MTPKKPISVKTYVVVSGDSLWKIANKHHTTVQAIKEKNRMSSDKLKIGQTLVMP
ncbi:MAG: LysM peptidoglycan-binding domain-containing protein [Verrucomicrobia bacterium]|nr:LysM peptidoglycan-binding domain-containing protein [Verrucomicrobiota bacterium]